MNSEKMIGEFELMRNENWKYKYGGAERGLVDCSGAFLYVLGNKLIKEHSSNWMARKAVKELLPISEAKAGMAAFKRREPTTDTPARWLDGKGDFYHVGLIGRDSKTVLHASSEKTGFIESSINKQWTHCGWLIGVNYSVEDDTYEVIDVDANATVSVETTLNVRQGAGTGYAKIDELKAGERVVVQNEVGDWSAILYAGGSKSGFVASRYLKMDEIENIEEQVYQTKYTTLLNVENGQTIVLVGIWRVADD